MTVTEIQLTSPIAMPEQASTISADDPRFTRPLIEGRTHENPWPPHLYQKFQGNTVVLVGAVWAHLWRSLFWGWQVGSRVGELDRF
jgi:hypothetical protein